MIEKLSQHIIFHERENFFSKNHAIALEEHSEKINEIIESLNKLEQKLAHYEENEIKLIPDTDMCIKNGKVYTIYQLRAMSLEKSQKEEENLISIFTTKIDWFDPEDKLPPKRTDIFIAIKDATIVTGFHDGNSFVIPSMDEYMKNTEIFRWAEMPEFE